MRVFLIAALMLSLALASGEPATAQFQRTVDFGDVAVGQGVVKPVASKLNTSNEVRTYTGTIEGSTQFFFDPAVQPVEPGGMIFMFVVFHPLREGPDSAIARLGSSPTAYETFHVKGRGVAPSGVSASDQADEVRIRSHDDAAEAVAEIVQQRAGRVRISVWSLDGRMVSQPVDELAGPGAHSFRLDLESLSSGAYLCRIESSGGVQSAIIGR